MHDHPGWHEAIDPGRAGRGFGDGDRGLIRSILDGAHEAFISMDAGGCIIEWNLEAERTFGFARQEVLGRKLAETIIPNRYRAAHWRAVERFLASGETSVIVQRRELTGLHRAGDEFPIEMTIAYAGFGDRAPGQITFHAFLHDISVRKLSERVLIAMQSVTRAMARADSPFDAMQSLVATLGETMRWDIGAYWRVTEDGTLVRSASWWSSNSDAEEFVEQGSTLRLASGEGFPGLALQRGEPVWVRDFTTETTFPRIDSARRAGLHAAICVPVVRGAEIVGVLEFLTAELRVRDSLMTEALATVGEQVGELLGILEERQALVAGLARLALTDQLTSLPNRRAWEEGLTRELARATRDGHPVCVAVIDVDDFKRYNDRHGHQAGDALLAATVTAWQAQLRGGDLLARYGGDEFAAVIPAWPLDTAMMVIDRFRAVTPSGQTCSAGVACWDGIETAVELFGRADAALYKAKQAGRDRTVAA